MKVAIMEIMTALAAGGLLLQQGASGAELHQQKYEDDAIALWYYEGEKDGVDSETIFKREQYEVDDTVGEQVTFDLKDLNEVGEVGISREATNDAENEEDEDAERKEKDATGIHLDGDEEDPNNEEELGMELTKEQSEILDALHRNGSRLLASGANQYSGVWATTSPQSRWVSQRTRSNFISVWKTWSKQGYRLVDLDISGNGASRRYAGVYHKKTGGYALWMGFNWKGFVNKWIDEHNKGRRLIDIEVYNYNGVAYYDGVFISGTYGQKMWKATRTHFINKWASWSSSGWRLVDLETFVENGKRWYVGIFKPGSGSYALWMDASWSSFVNKWKTWTKNGLRLIDFDQYYKGGAWRYLGVFRQGSGGHYLWAGVDYENFKSKDYQLKQLGLHLTDISFNLGHGKCSSTCANDVIGTKYNYRLTGDSTTYRWPVIEDGSSTYVRHSAVSFSNPGFYLPYSDTDVKLTSGWQYTSNNYHYALDMSQGSSTFALKAVADGKIIFVGWDNWSGNSVVLESGDWRIIYMHVRNGKTNDCNKAWDETIPWLSSTSPAKAEYETYLSNSGCQENNRQPQEFYWGTNSQTIPVSVGDNVKRGDVVAYTGNTGPGGKRGSSSGANTHLHIFFTRKDSTDNKWYFVDPYGIYSTTSCYPSKLGPLNTPCARYSIAWKLTSGGELMYA